MILTTVAPFCKKRGLLWELSRVENRGRCSRHKRDLGMRVAKVRWLKVVGEAREATCSCIPTLVCYMSCFIAWLPVLVRLCFGPSVHSSIHPFIPSFVCLTIHPLFHSSIRSSICSPACVCVCVLIPSFVTILVFPREIYPSLTISQFAFCESG